MCTWKVFVASLSGTQKARDGVKHGHEDAMNKVKKYLGEPLGR